MQRIEIRRSEDLGLALSEACRELGLTQVQLAEQKVAVLRRTGPGDVSCEGNRQTLAEHSPGAPSVPRARGGRCRREPGGPV